MLGANLYLSTNGTQTRYNTGRSGSAVQFGYSGTIRFYNNSGNNAPTERLRINSAGKVLVGSGVTDGSLFNVKGQLVLLMMEQMLEYNWY